MLDRTNYFIKEHAGVFKMSDTYDIIDPETRQNLGVAQEKLSFLVHALRLVIDKRMLPTKVEISEQVNGPALLTIKRGMTFLRSRIEIVDRSGQAIGYFKSKLFSLGGGFFVYDMRDQLIAEVKGDWKGWNFKFLDAKGNEKGTVSKKWAGIGKELFTTADNYMISIADDFKANAGLLLAAGLAIDIVFKER
ncbi:MULTISPECIES: phospholipid scramblase-related protein [unclassified Duganella]|uniref:phospholipid scramblase-related protein n=1 Tax=unclassified Duganella TaxID=2636909 RepID=UPI0006FED0D0|nr:MULTISPECIES: phospholipid scramblase-related protein [unclassified Duganella]KQV50992.1 oxidoreductase [Duganella sp. Root336D2]KRC00570.1 oxidoreductase [Duganella sp. Root198D2]